MARMLKLFAVLLTLTGTILARKPEATRGPIVPTKEVPESVEPGQSSRYKPESQESSATKNDEDEDEDEENEDDKENETQSQNVQEEDNQATKRSLFNANGKYQILPLKQKGVTVPGHYLKIDGNKLSASAIPDDPKSKFNMYTLINPRNTQLYIQIIESAVQPRKVIAVNKSKNKVVVKTCSKPPMKYTKFKDILKSDPEILWVSKPISPTSMYFTYCLYPTTGSTNYCLDFDTNGKPRNPSTVNPIPDEAFFVNLFAGFSSRDNVKNDPNLNVS